MTDMIIAKLYHNVSDKPGVLCIMNSGMERNYKHKNHIVKALM